LILAALTQEHNSASEVSAERNHDDQQEFRPPQANERIRVVCVEEGGPCRPGTPIATERLCTASLAPGAHASTRVQQGMQFAGKTRWNSIAPPLRCSPLANLSRFPPSAKRGRGPRFSPTRRHEAGASLLLPRREASRRYATIRICTTSPLMPATNCSKMPRSRADADSFSG
jgi:hypothetical protein